MAYIAADLRQAFTPEIANVGDKTTLRVVIISAFPQTPNGLDMR
jgi:hypothetical protein